MKHKLRLFGNKVSSKIFGTKKGMEKFPQCGTSWFAFPAEYLLGDQISKNNNTEGACDT